MKKNILIMIMIFILKVSLNAMATLPVSPERDSIYTMHNTQWNDEYAYLSDKHFEKQKKAYLSMEKNYFKSINSRFWRMNRHISSSNVAGPKFYTSVPYRKGDWYYYSTFDAYFPNGVYYRINRNTKETKMYFNAEDILSNKRMAILGKTEISPDNKYFAYMADFKGDENYRLFIKDIHWNKLLKKKLNNVDDFYWANNGKYLIYAERTDNGRSYRLIKHIPQSETANDTILYEDKNPAYEHYLKLSKSKDTLFFMRSIGKHYEMYKIDLNKDDSSLNSIKFAHSESIPLIDCYNGYYYYLSYFENSNNCLYRQNVNDPLDIEMLYQGSDNNPLTGFEIFNDYIAINILDQGQSRVIVYNKFSKETYKIDFLQKNYSLSTSDNYEADTDSLSLIFSSLSRPVTIFQINMKNRDLKIRQKISPSKYYDVKDYEEKTVYVTSADSTLIPLTIVYNKNMFKGDNPCLLEAYGSYGVVDDLNFSYMRMKMLDRGWIYAYAHVRGGGEFGSLWHDEGKLLNKKNSIVDFLACSEYLINNNYTSPLKLAIMGASAGGTIIGAAINQRPELFNTAIALVPSVDIISPLLDSTDASANFHYNELGDPRNKVEFDYLYSYSPYHNMKAQNYPNIYVTTGENDSRVSPEIPLKWVCKLRIMNKSNSTIVLKYTKNSGHSGTYEEEELYSFLIWTIEKNKGKNKEESKDSFIGVDD